MPSDALSIAIPCHSPALPPLDPLEPDHQEEQNENPDSLIPLEKEKITASGKASSQSSWLGFMLQMKLYTSTRLTLVCIRVYDALRTSSNMLFDCLRGREISALACALACSCLAGSSDVWRGSLYFRAL